jgi:hypothetical protein
VLIQFGPVIADQKVPSIHDLVKGDDLRIVRAMELSERVGLGFWVRPEVPKDRVAILRKAMDAVGRDPAIVAEGAKRGAPVDPLSGAEIATLVQDAYALPENLRARMRAMVGAKGMKKAK